MVKVYPTRSASLNLVHPMDGQLKLDGSFWTYDGFTCRCLTDGAVTEEEAKAYKPAPKPAEGKSSPDVARVIGDSAQSRTPAA